MIFWILTLSLVVFFLFLLPLVPGLIELIRPTDVTPLRVVQEYDNTPFYFADGFRSYIRSQFSEGIHSPQNHNGKLVDSTKFQLIGEKGEPQLEATGITSKLLLSAHPMTLPSGELFESEVYGMQSIMTGSYNHFRALLADGNLHLRDECVILRWAHSNGEMVIGRNSMLYGRATSHHSIILGDHVQFERLHAPQIITASPQAFPEARNITHTILTELPDVNVHSARRWVLKGHLDFPAEHRFTGDIISATTAVIGDDAHIEGSVKCNAYNDIAKHLQSVRQAAKSPKHVARCEVGNRVCIEGSLVSSYDLVIGTNCRIMGPVLAENMLVIGRGTIIGTPTRPTTVTAPRILIEEGCTIYGTLWATQSGMVTTSKLHEVAA